MTTLHFDEADIDERIPPPGFYRSKITSARFKWSSNGNRMLQVVYALLDVDAGRNRVADYFVLEGTTAYAIARARKRLVELYRATGIEPQSGDEIAPADLFGAELEVKLEHDQWDGRLRLRAVGYRRLGSGPAGDVPF